MPNYLSRGAYWLLSPDQLINWQAQLKWLQYPRTRRDFHKFLLTQCLLLLEQNKHAMPAAIPTEIKSVAVPGFLDQTLFGGLLVSEALIILVKQQRKIALPFTIHAWNRRSINQMYKIFFTRHQKPPSCWKCSRRFNVLSTEGAVLPQLNNANEAPPHK